MLNLDATQAALVAATSKDIKWAFSVIDANGVGYSFASEPLGAVAWATGITWDDGISWDDGTNLSSVVLTDFSGIELRRNMAENTVIAPSEVTFTISNPEGAIDFADFKGGSVLIELFLSNTTVEKKIAGWKFKIKTADPAYQQLKITAEDFLQSYLNGYYPNTRNPDDIFPSNRTYNNDALCVPVPFGTAYVPLRDVYITGEGGFILLGNTNNTYTINKIRSPRSWGAKSEWDSGSFAFTQSTKADADAVDWRVFQAIIADSDNDGDADAAGFWGSSGGPVLDPPVQFSRSDTVSLTNPADVIEFVLEDMGIPSAMIDPVTFAAAKVTFTSWGLTFNGAFWYKQDREKVLASLLTMCHSCLDVGETIQLRVLSKTSQKTITGAEVLRTSEQGEGTFTYHDLANEDLADSGYVAFQPDGEAQDELIKALVGVDGAPDVLSDEVLECPFVQDAQNVKRIGTLHFERKLMKEAEAGFTAKSTCLALQPDDVLTINDTNYGGEYAVLTDSVKINPDASIQFICSHYSITFNDWDDLTPAVLTVPEDDTDGSWQIVMSGPDDNYDLNALQGRIRVGTGADYILITPHNPLRISIYDDGTEILRQGNLNGFAGYVTDKYGYAAYIDADNFFKVDPTNGIRMSGSITITNQGDINTSEINNDLGWTDDTTAAQAASLIAGWAMAGHPTYIDGSSIFAQSITADKFISTLYGDLNQAMSYVKTVLSAGAEYEHTLTDSDLSGGSGSDIDAYAHADYGASIRLATATLWDDGGAVWDTGTWDEPTDTSGSWTSASMDMGSSKTSQMALRYTVVEDNSASTSVTISAQYSMDNVSFGTNADLDDSTWETLTQVTESPYKATGNLFTFRYFKIKVELVTTDTSDRIILHTMSYIGNVVNIFGQEVNKTIAAGGTTISLNGFNTTPAITVTPVGATALVPLITAQSKDSVTVKLYNLAGNSVGGVCNLTIIGV